MAGLTRVDSSEQNDLYGGIHILNSLQVGSSISHGRLPCDHLDDMRINFNCKLIYSSVFPIVKRLRYVYSFEKERIQVDTVVGMIKTYVT